MITRMNEWSLSKQGNYHLEQTYELHKGARTREVAVTMMINPIYSGWHRGEWHWRIRYCKFGVSNCYEGNEHTLQAAMDKADEIAWNSIQEMQRMIDEGNY